MRRLGLGVALVGTAVACVTEHEIEQPTPLFAEVPIEYPLHMWDEDMEGETVLRVRVDADGARPETSGSDTVR